MAPPDPRMAGDFATTHGVTEPRPALSPKSHRSLAWLSWEADRMPWDALQPVARRLREGERVEVVLLCHTIGAHVDRLVAGRLEYAKGDRVCAPAIEVQAALPATSRRTSVFRKAVTSG